MLMNVVNAVKFGFADSFYAGFAKILLVRDDERSRRCSFVTGPTSFVIGQEEPPERTHDTQAGLH
jgi:hypothetical protein